MRAYRVAYDGRGYFGFQRQPDVETVEDALLDGLANLGLEFDDVPTGWAAAGRTDAGVSALAQTVAFEAPQWLSPRAFTAQLPTDIHVWASSPVPAAFHATHDPNQREYTYLLHAPAPDAERIEAIETRLSGEHDVHNLAAETTGTVRDLSITSRQQGEFRRIRVRADGFPRQLVRRLVTLYERVLTGAASLSFIDRVYSPDPLSGPDGIEPASAYPLVLTGVEYGLEFDVDMDAAEQARAAFDTQNLRARTSAAVTALLERGVSRSGPRAGNNP